MQTTSPCPWQCNGWHPGPRVCASSSWCARRLSQHAGFARPHTFSERASAAGCTPCSLRCPGRPHGVPACERALLSDPGDPRNPAVPCTPGAAAGATPPPFHPAINPSTHSTLQETLALPLKYTALPALRAWATGAWPGLPAASARQPALLRVVAWPWRPMAAMRRHQSQLVWFRYLWLLFSSYMHTNQLVFTFGRSP